MSIASHPYAAFLSKVERPARYAGGEVNQVVKDWSAVEVTLALAFPDIYDIGMSHLGTKILYSLLNKDARIACERCFAPWSDLEAELRNRRLPLVSLESARPLKDFDVVGFSLQYELTYTNILLMLDLGGIPLRAAARADGDPLVIAGGPVATHAEPMAPFIDAFVIGDGEEKLPELLVAWKRLRREGVVRGEALKRLAGLGGIYVPSLYAVEDEPLTGIQVVARPADESLPFPVQRAFLVDINKYPFPDDTPVPHSEAIFDRMAVEIARGCTEGCRFCQAGMIYRPVREREPESILKTVEGSLVKGGYDEVSLTSLSTADYSAVAPLVEKAAKLLTPKRVSMSVSSLRAYGLPEAVLDDLKEVRGAGLTFAPEAGTQRMRDVITKNVSDEDIERTSHRVFSRGWDKVKLYFMIGLPTERDEDVRGIAETGARVRRIGLGYHPPQRLRVTVSVSSHVPKPHTPFQWAAFDPPALLHEKQALLRGMARDHHLDLKTHDVSTGLLEAIYARGDRRLGDVVERAYALGARFDGWDERFKLEAWEQAFTDMGIDRARYLATMPVEARLPWDHLDVGLAPGFLLKEYRKALKDRLSPPCGKPFGAIVHHTNLKDALADDKRLICYDCGVACDLTAMREERIAFLTTLGATEPRIAKDAPAPVRSPGRTPRPAPRPGFDAVERHTLRVLYTKLDLATLTGHLDFGRALARLVRRAGLEPAYSQGFHPKPVMAFGPALALGTPSLAEVVDLELSQRYEVDEALARLTAASPTGVRFTAGRYIAEGERGLGKSAVLADYLVAVEGSIADDDMLARRVDLALKPGGLTARCTRKGVASERALAGELVGAWWAEGDERAHAFAFPDTSRLVLVRLGAAAAVRAAEAVAALLDDARVAGAGRVALWGPSPEGLVDPLGRPPGAEPGLAGVAAAPAAAVAPAASSPG